MTPINRLLSAKVEWWNDREVYVRCPLCKNHHRHAFDGNYSAEHRRSSHCGDRETYCSYRLQFPIGKMPNDVAYDIDKQRALFVASGADPAAYFEKFEDLSSMDLSSQRKWSEAKEMTIAPWGDPGDTFRRIDLAVESLVNGRVEEVRNYLEKSPEADLFIHGTDVKTIQFLNSGPDDGGGDLPDGRCLTPVSDEITVSDSGQSALHYAAMEKGSEMVELLLQHGANPNAQDLRGRTPLVEAALWGRLKSVNLLLRSNANTLVESTRDGKRLKPIDFARPLSENRQERYRRLAHPNREDEYRRDQDRAAIVCTLEEEDEDGEEGPIHLTLSGFAFSSGSPSVDNMKTLIAHFDVPNKVKTVGVLYPGSKLPLVAAMSGWLHQELPDANIQIAGRTWTTDVIRLSKTVGHELPEHQYDQGIPGQYNACHAEKQLIAYFVHKHMFLCHELKESSPPRRGLTWEDVIADLNGLRLSEEDEEAENMKMKLSALRRAQPANTLRKVTIMVSTRLCGDCLEFKDTVNRVLGVEISLFHRCLISTCEDCRM